MLLSALLIYCLTLAVNSRDALLLSLLASRAAPAPSLLSSMHAWLLVSLSAMIALPEQCPLCLTQNRRMCRRQNLAFKWPSVGAPRKSLELSSSTLHLSTIASDPRLSACSQTLHFCTQANKERYDRMYPYIGRPDVLFEIMCKSPPDYRTPRELLAVPSYMPGLQTLPPELCRVRHASCCRAQALL